MINNEWWKHKINNVYTQHKITPSKRSLIIGAIKKAMRPLKNVNSFAMKHENFKESLIIFQVWCMIKC